MKFKILSWIKNYVPKIITLILLYLMVAFVQLPIAIIMRSQTIMSNSTDILMWLVVYFVAFAVAILIARKVYLDHTHHPIRKVTKADVWLVVKCYVLAMIVEIILNYFNFISSGQTNSENNVIIKNILSSNRLVLIAMAVSAVCLSPILEEFVFRGYAMDAFFSANRFWWPILFSGLVFASGHSVDTLISFVTYVILGMFMAYVYKRSNNIRVSMLMHSLNNLIAVVQMLILILH